MPASGLWQINDYPAANTQATATQAAPGGPYQNRLRTLSARLSGTAAGTAKLVVRDGASGVGAIIFAATLSMPIDGSDKVELSDMDLRSSFGNALTVEFTGGGGANTQESISAQGDLVPEGYAPYSTA